MVRKITIFGIGLILLGAVLIVGPTFGFSTIAADRGVNINAAGDEDAYISIATDNVYNDERITLEDSQPLVNLENKFGQTVGGDDGTVRVEVVDVSGDIDDNDVIEMSGSPTIDPGENTDIEFICRNDEPRGTNTIDVLLEVSKVSGSTVSVEKRLLEESIEDVEVQCNQGEQTDSGLRNVAVSDLIYDQDNEEQTVEFELAEELPKDESVTITLEDVSQGNRIDYNDATVSSDLNGIIDTEASTNQDYIIEFDPDEALTEGKTVTITIKGIDTTGNNAVDEYDANFVRNDINDPEELVPAFEVKEE